MRLTRDPLVKIKAKFSCHWFLLTIKRPTNSSLLYMFAQIYLISNQVLAANKIKHSEFFLKIPIFFIRIFCSWWAKLTLGSHTTPRPKKKYDYFNFLKQSITASLLAERGHTNICIYKTCLNSCIAHYAHIYSRRGAEQRGTFSQSCGKSGGTRKN